MIFHIFEISLLCSPSLHLFDQNAVEKLLYCEMLEYILFSILIYFKKKCIPFEMKCIPEN